MVATRHAIEHRLYLPSARLNFSMLETQPAMGSYNDGWCFMTDKVYIPGPVERCRATDVTRDGAVGRDFVDPMASILERQCRRYGNVRMRDRKPRYDRAVSVGRTNMVQMLPTIS